MAATTLHPVADGLNKIAAELKTTFLEREEAIDAMNLAVLSGEHAFILGPPGTSKSLLVRSYVEAITGASYFEVALSKTRPAEAVLGPLNIKEFRENGNYFLKRAGFATQVDLAFFDEIGKMSPVLGHDLLALFNERVYHEVNGGRSVHVAPLHTAFTASNEMPMNESDDAAALWDRLLIRTIVDYLKEKKNFSKLLTGDIPPVQARVDFKDIKQAVETDVAAIPFSKDGLDAMVKLRTKMRAEKLEPSDRRWKASVKVLRAQAFLDGDVEIGEHHMAALRFTLWDQLEEVEKVTQMCQSASNPFVEPMQEVEKIMKDIEKGIKDRKDDQQALGVYGGEASKKLQAARDRLDEVMKSAGTRKIPGLEKVADKHRDLMLAVFVECLGAEKDVAEIAIAGKLGMGGGTPMTVEEA